MHKESVSLGDLALQCKHVSQGCLFEWEGLLQDFCLEEKFWQLFPLLVLLLLACLFQKQLGCSWASLMAQMVKNPLAMQETQVRSLGQEDPWRREWLSTPVFLPGEFHGQRSQTDRGWASVHGVTKSWT